MDESLYQKFTLRDPSIDLSQTLADLIDFESASLQFEPQLVRIESNNSEVLTKKRSLRQKWSSWLESWRRQEKRKTPFKPQRRVSLAKRIHSSTKSILKNKHNENYESERRLATLSDRMATQLIYSENSESESQVRDNESCKNVAQHQSEPVAEIGAPSDADLRNQLHCQRSLQVSRYYKYFSD